MKKIINALNANPMFRLSMSSLELFHSNFLEWLFDLDHDAFLKCFDLTVTNPTACTIEREYHLGRKKEKQWVTDIAVFKKADDKNEKKKKDAKTDKNEKLILIIENKIKSTPSKGQLENQKGLADPDCKKILLSLFEYSVSKDKTDGFDKVLYKDLIGKIRTNYALHTYIKDYCDMLDRLQEILDQDQKVIDWRGGYYTAHLSSTNLETCGIMDAFRKYQAASLANEFENRFIAKNTTGLQMTCEHSLNNKHACTTIAYELNDRLNVGVQIEHDQLRIFFEDKKKSFNIDNVDAYWNNWFKPLTPQGKSTKKGGPAYCSYNMSKSLFIYRYVKFDDIWGPNPIAIDKLCIRVEDLLNKIIAEYHSGKIFYVLK